MTFWTFLFLVFGFGLLIKAADILVDGAAGLAKKFKVPKVIIGLTLVAFGTSAPEGTVSIIAAVQGNADISLGNIIGSNIANIALVLGVAAIIRQLTVRRVTITKEIPLSIFAILALIFMGYDQFFQQQNVGFNNLSLGDGLMLLSFFVVFLYYIFGDLKSSQIKEEEIEKKEMANYKESYWYLSLLVLGGLAGIMVGGKLVVDQAVIIAIGFGVSEALIGLTIVALGTSLPELATAVMAARKNEDDIAIGTIMGSNIFNVFLVLGITALIKPLNFDPKLLLDAFFALFISIIFFIFLLKEKVLTRFHGSLLLFFYAAYIISLGFRETVMAFFGG
ncbi:calcium/sodium antiporter [Patescibacteria group bacterium]|nr:calcium/sodium antiporter [Patescibacteria group bacterium]MBU1703163.1 calcium/sodium antiporter [Patescibacteria group bacterium]MBU1954320.1 calcium/sodium antiporter [Patescibacteria group bacterium]